MTKSVKMSPRQIMDRWQSGGNLHGIEEKDDGGLTYEHETLQTAALIDISRSLRRMVSIMECPSFQRSVPKIASIDRLLREYLIQPRPKKKAKRKAKPRPGKGRLKGAR